MRRSTQAAILILLATFTAVARAETYELPTDWQGQQDGQTEGNPILVNGQPLWRFEQVVGKLEDGEYLPMTWAKKSWRGPKEYGGQPSINFNRSTLMLSARGPWSGIAGGHRTPALIFIAPKDGKFTVTGNASANVWNGDKPGNLVILKRPAKSVAVEVTRVELPKGAPPKPLEGVTVQLAKGEELIFVNHMPTHHTAANVQIAQMRIARED